MTRRITYVCFLEYWRGRGYEVRSAISGSIALMAVASFRPDLILLDVNMPRMNGYEVCECLKADEQTCDIPIIFLSAMGETIDKVRAFGSGGVGLHHQAFQVEEVIARIESQLKLRRMQVELAQSLAREQELNQLSLNSSRWFPTISAPHFAAYKALRNCCATTVNPYRWSSKNNISTKLMLQWSTYFICWMKCYLWAVLMAAELNVDRTALI
jgi:CheY-like chemotaxis protein